MKLANPIEASAFQAGLLALLAVLYLVPGCVLAHPAEQALVMLLPTGFYTAAGTVAVALTIVLIAVLPVRRMHRVMSSYAVPLAFRVGKAPLLGSLVSTVCLLLLILIGYAGPDDPQSNLLPLSIWTGWWVGVFVVQGLVFDVWKWINPWSGLAWLVNDKPLLHFPEWWGAWPAVIVFTLFQFFLIVDIAPADPNRLASIVLLYWLITMAGIVVFGERAWLNQVECFSVLFRLIGSLRVCVVDKAMHIGLPGYRSTVMAPLSLSLSVFSLMILISGSFDGLRESFWWLALIDVNPLEFPGRSAVMVSSGLGLLLVNVGVIAFYGLSIWVGLLVVSRVSGAVSATGGSACGRFLYAFNTFSVSILPIALGYHFAHYLVSYLVQIQVWVAALADPLARGWNLFGLGSYRVTTGFLNSMDTVKPILLTNVYAVVVSHIVAVVMAHYLASRIYQTRRDVVLIQSGLSIFMLAYTLFGLWLLSTPRGA